MRARATRISVLGAALLLLAGSASGGSGSSWSPPSVLGGPGIWGERVAVDARGHATAVWATRDGTEDGAVQVVDRPAGGRWSAPQDVSPPGMWAYGAPDLGVDAAGSATVVWASGTFPDVVVRSAYRPAGGTFAPATDLAPPARNVFGVRVAVDAKGDAVAMWDASEGSRYVLRAAYRPAGGSYGAAEDVVTFTPDAQVPSFDLAIDSQGDVVAVWAEYPSPRSLVRTSFRPAQGSFDTPVTLAVAASNSFVEAPDVAIDASGNATAVWWNAGTIQSARRSIADGAWEFPRDLAGGGSPTIAIDGGGVAVVAWVSTPDGVARVIDVSVRPAGADTWSPPVELSRPDDVASGPVVAAGPAGDMVVAWSGPPNIIEASVRPPGGSFGPAQDVSQAGVYLHGGPKVAVDPRGTATLVWSVVRDPQGRYRTSGYVQSARHARSGTAAQRTVRVAR